MRKQIRFAGLCLPIGLLAVAVCGGLGAQAAPSACGPPPLVAANAKPNIFSEQQEEWLGDAVADQIEREYRLPADPAQSAYLQAIADRLAATIPNTHLHFRVQVVDSSVVNGFSLAGGRIYITRKLAAAAQNDDELASVIGHEMGHSASHQFAFEETANFRRYLNVTSVGDRADIFAKFQRLVDAEMRDKRPTAGGDTDDKQDEADRIGVYVIAAAGYRPQANDEFWDRMFFTHGKTGGRFSDFFGISKPQERRLGRIRKLVASLPSGCGGTQPVVSAGFAEWHRLVIENRRHAAPSIDIAQERNLTPPLHMDLDHVRFSPNGKLLLAQDESSVFAISLDTSSVLFRADAEDALPAYFSPDSQNLVFATQGLHTETWSTAERKLVQAHEPRSPNHCLQAKLSPDGRTVSCLQINVEGASLDLSLLDAESGDALWSKKAFFQPSMFFFTLMMLTHGEEWVGDYVPSSFSPDGNFLLIGPGTAKVAFDLRTRTQIKIGSDLRDVPGQYGFLGNNLIAGVNSSNAKDSGLYSFPEGKRVKKLALPFERVRTFSAPENTAYLGVKGVKDYRWEVADIQAGRPLLGTRTDALDMWNNTIATEGTDGAVALMDLTNGEISKPRRIALPSSPLAVPRESALSDDGRYLALSTRMHGGVWDVTTGKQIFRTPGFQGAGWNHDGKLYLEFAKIGDSPHSLRALELSHRDFATPPYTLADDAHFRYGLFIEVKDVGKAGTEVSLRDPANNAALWTRSFHDDMPRFTVSLGSRDLLFVYPMQSKAVKARIRENGTLAGEAALIHEKANGRLIEAVDIASGKTAAEIVLERPPDFSGVDGLNRLGDLLFVTGAQNRTIAYSLRDGKELWRANGTMVASDLLGRKVCLQNRGDEAIVYDEAGKEVYHKRLGTPLRFVSFADKGNKLLVLDADQKLRSLDIAREMSAAVVSSR